jgi:hypothetical protein
MKKIFVLQLFFVCFFATAQNREKGDIEITPIIGYANSNYVSNKPISNNPISSVDFGVNADYYFNNRWSLRSALLLQSMGSEYFIFEKLEDKLEYITIPVNANWHFGSERSWNLNFGPSFGFLVSAKTNGEDVKEYAESFQIGLSFGIGYKLTINEKIGILIDLQGVSSFTEDVKDGSNQIRNSYSVLNVGCVYKL